MPSTFPIVAGLLGGAVLTALFFLARTAKFRRRINLLEQQNRTLGEEGRRLREECDGHLRRCAEAEALSCQLKESLENARRECGSLGDKVLETTRSNAELLATNRAMTEKLENQSEELLRIRKEFRSEFENLANRILEEKSRKFTESNETNIRNLLRPLGENIENFRKKVEETYDRESKERFSLGKEVEKLVEMNIRISQEANNLTNALKGNSKIQGDWGEMILENILESSGLTRNREYFLQETLKDRMNFTLRNEQGQRMVPDVLIRYPDGREVVIDSKVSLTHYAEYCSESDPEECGRLARHHLASVRRHIDELNRRDYQQHVESLDFVMMFVPSEPAYILALQEDPALWNYAYSKGVLLISPTNLITSLKLIADLWSREYQNRNALEIAKRGAGLYDKFVGFVENMRRIGHQIDKTRESYRDAMNQLESGRGNLIGQVDKLRDLGVKAKKSLGLNDPAETKEKEMNNN